MHNPLGSLRCNWGKSQKADPLPNLTKELPVIEDPVELRMQQERWDRFFQTALARQCNPNPELRRDYAMDETLRALGRRARGPLSAQERAALALREEVDDHFAEANRTRNYGKAKGKGNKKSSKYKEPRKK